MVEFINDGDIFALDFVYSYAHGCNCAGAMGKGIALQFKQKFPKMYQEYKLLCQQGRFNPGDVFDYNYGKGYVFNLGTQLTWRTKANIDYIKKAVIKMLDLAVIYDVKSIALPAIGSGLGKANWNEIKILIQNIALNYPTVNLYVIENYSMIFNEK